MDEDGVTALTVREEAVPSLLLGSPGERVTQATAIANALAPVITKKHLYVDISGRKHVLYEGWATLGALVGVFPVTTETRQDEDGAWARVEARTLAGAVVGAAEAVCRRDEDRWKNAEDYAVLSMAQTRAGSKALRMPLGFIMQLAGFEGTPAEEMDGVGQRRPRGGQKVIPNQAKLAAWMREKNLNAADVLRLLDVAFEEGNPREAWDIYIADLKESKGYDDDGAYGAILGEIGAE